MFTTRAIILAAGLGTRMHSSLPKVLHSLMGHPMVWYALQAVRKATQERPVMVVGHGAEQVSQAVGNDAEYVLQEHALGTGHAVMQAGPLLRGKSDYVLVTYADMPLLRTETMVRLVQRQQENPGPMTLLTCIADDHRGFGRIVRDDQGRVQEIVEDAALTPAQREIRELNMAVYCFRADWLWESLPQIPLSLRGEYYLTDLVGMAVRAGLAVEALPTDDPVEMVGINTRVHLAEANALLRQRINRQWMLSGVTLIDPLATYIEPEVEIGQDTTVWPGTHLCGKTSIGQACEIGPNTIVRDSRIGNRCKIVMSVLEDVILEDDANIGPLVSTHGVMGKG